MDQVSIMEMSANEPLLKAVRRSDRKRRNDVKTRG